MTTQVGGGVGKIEKKLIEIVIGKLISLLITKK